MKQQNAVLVNTAVLCFPSILPMPPRTHPTGTDFVLYAINDISNNCDDIGWVVMVRSITINS